MPRRYGRPAMTRQVCMPGVAPRTAEDIIRAGDLHGCGYRELLDLVSELGLSGAFEDDLDYSRLRVLRVLKAHGREMGWL